jgi:stage V sporulation protein AE
LANGVRKEIDELGFMGIFTGGFTASSAGIAVALICGLIVSLAFKPKAK